MALIDVIAREPSVAADANPVEAPDERLRKAVVSCVHLLFVMLILEGLIRKWVAPEYSRVLYFVRDPVVLLTYVLALRAGAFQRVHALLVVGLVFAVLMIPVAAMQLSSSGSPAQLLFAAYGWRNYFLYLPLPFLIAATFRLEDLGRFCRFAIVALTFAAPVAVLQFLSSPNAPINVGSSDDIGLQFQNIASANGHIRPAGLFTSILGMVELTASTAAFVLACWIMPRGKRPAPASWTIVGSVAIAASLAVSGSRSMYLQVALVIMAALVSGLLMRRSALLARATTIPIVLVGAFILLFPVLFPEGFSTIVTRWTAANQVEAGGTSGRALANYLDFLPYVGRVPLIGYGLGLGGNAAILLDAANVSQSADPYGGSRILTAETDWARHLLDLGSVLGLLFIAYRVVFTGYLGMVAARATWRSGNALPVLLFGYVGIVLLQEQITGNGVVNGFVWIYVGLCMAASRIAARMRPSGNTEPPMDVEAVRPRNMMS
jgi:hypothetical protein